MGIAINQSKALMSGYGGQRGDDLGRPLQTAHCSVGQARPIAFGVGEGAGSDVAAAIDGLRCC